MIRSSILRFLDKVPYFKGRDYLIGKLAKSFCEAPVKLQSGVSMYLDLSEWVQLDIYIKGSTEPITSNRIESILSVGDTMIDVGAHVGFHSISAGRIVGQTGKVIPIDPQPYCAERIAKNACLNNMAQVSIICAAVGQTPGYFQISLQSDRDRSRLSLNASGPCDLGTRIEVPIRTLDEVFETNQLNMVNLVKIDVEGFEPEVLQGFRRNIDKCKNIILEILPDVRPVEVKAMIESLRICGFNILSVDGKRWNYGEFTPENNIWASRENVQ